LDLEVKKRCQKTQGLIMNFVLTLLRSNRVKAAIFALVMALFAKYLPDYAPSPETMNWLYGVVIALIAGDTVRPVDPGKPALFQTRQPTLRDKLT